MDFLEEFLAFAGPITLAVMGGIVAFFPPESNTPYKWFWVFGFVAIGVLSAIAAIRANRANAGKLTELTTGGKHFCYFRVMPSDLKRSSPHFQLYLDATGTVYDVNYWISPAAAKGNGNDPTYMSLDVRKPLLQVVYAGPHAWDRALPLGDYLIQFDGRNGHWREHLSLGLENGIIVQKIRVETDRETTRLETSDP